MLPILFQEKISKKTLHVLGKKFSPSSSIPKTFCKKKIFVHTGKATLPVIINRQIIGSKIGNFILTRKPFYFPKKLKSKKR